MQGLFFVLGLGHCPPNPQGFGGGACSHGAAGTRPCYASSTTSNPRALPNSISGAWTSP